MTTAAQDIQPPISNRFVSRGCEPFTSVPMGVRQFCTNLKLMAEREGFDALVARLDVDGKYLREVIRGAKVPGAKMLKRLGFKRTVQYQESSTSVTTEPQIDGWPLCSGLPPPARCAIPLTELEIEELFDEASGADHGTHIRLVRLVEQHHRIDNSNPTATQAVAMIAACAEYLKEGETPAERIEREIKDCAAVTGLLASARSATAASTPTESEIQAALDEPVGNGENVKWSIIFGLMSDDDQVRDIMAREIVRTALTAARNPARKLIQEFIDLCAIGDIDENSDDGIGWAELIRDAKAFMLAGAPPCEHCDGTGDVHSIDGEWRGVCVCPAGQSRR